MYLRNHYWFFTHKIIKVLFYSEFGVAFVKKILKLGSKFFHQLSVFHWKKSQFANSLHRFENLINLLEKYFLGLISGTTKKHHRQCLVKVFLTLSFIVRPFFILWIAFLFFQLRALLLIFLLCDLFTFSFFQLPACLQLQMTPIFTFQLIDY